MRAAPWVFFYELGDVDDGIHTLPPNPPLDAERSDAQDWFHGKYTPTRLRRAAHEWRVARHAAGKQKRDATSGSDHVNWNHRACTGILALPSDRSMPMLHGRNMDESPKEGRNCTLNVTFVQGGEVQFHAFDWVWMTSGFLTGSRVGGVTLELNWREHGYVSLEDILLRIADPANVPTKLQFRHILSAKMNFRQSLAFMNTSTYAAPFYAITAGEGRIGAVVTASFNKTENYVEVLSDATDRKGWYMVQTNYDRWEPDPPRDPRRTVAEEHLAMLGRARGGSELGVWMTASVYPVHNPGTMYTALMRTDRAPEGYIRRAMVPDGGSSNNP